MRRNQMKWERGRRVMAILLSLVLILSSTGIAVFAEGIPDANADLTRREQEIPFLYRWWDELR